MLRQSRRRVHRGLSVFEALALSAPATWTRAKHDRRIALEAWQQEFVDRATEEFVVGLIHSDGCRVVANDRGVMSVRYHFTNVSVDILDLFTRALDRLAIRWRRSTQRTVSIYRKVDTARLDEFTGPKSRPVPWPCIEPRAS